MGNDSRPEGGRNSDLGAEADLTTQGAWRVLRRLTLAGKLRKVGLGPRSVRFYHDGGKLFCENRGQCPDHNTRYPVVIKGRPKLETKQHPNAGLKTRKHRKVQLA